jgi:hypothetical protein
MFSGAPMLLIMREPTQALHSMGRQADREEQQAEHVGASGRLAVG